jgi:hypothetical protein
MDVLWNTKQPYLALVDDDAHSARLLTRMLLAHGAPSIQWIEGAGNGLETIRQLLAGPAHHLPGLVIVDLKSSSSATQDFVRKLAGWNVPGRWWLWRWPPPSTAWSATPCSMQAPTRCSSVMPIFRPTGPKRLLL